MTRAGAGTRWGAALAAVVLVGAVATPARAAVPDAERAMATAYADGLRIESHTTYALDPAALLVHVRYDVTLKNTQPDVVSGGFIRQSYYSDFSIPTVAEAVNLAASKEGGGSLAVHTEPTDSPQFTFAVVDLVPNLFYPSSVHVTITYDIPALAPRAEGFTRVNKAFATFPTFTVGDPGISSVEVLVPEAFEVEVVGDLMVRSEREGGLVAYTADAIANPDTWHAEIVARDDDQLVLREVDLGEHDVQVQGWPDDPEWADFVAEQVDTGVPVLEELIGTDWPASQDIDVVETVAPYLYGFAGWYEPASSLIEVGDELEQQVILHELSHLWFNSELFGGRWISEGLAEEFATLAMDELDAEVPEPDAVKADDPGVLRLNAWSDPDLQNGQSEAQEAYGYNTSWSVLHGLVDEIGPERMRELLQTAFAEELPYGAETAPGTLGRRADWRTLLDLLEEVGGSATAEQVFRDLVVTPDQVALLDERLAARADYADLVEAGDGWSPPRIIRTQMSDWDFEHALDKLDDADAVLSVRDDLSKELAAIDEPMPPPFRAAYEDARDLDDLAALADDALAGGTELRDAQEANDDGAGPLGAVGLLFSSVDEDLTAAHSAFQAGDFDLAAERSAAVSDQMDGAATAGLFRLLGAAVVAGALWWVVRRLRGLRRRRRARAAARAAEGVGEDLVIISATTAPGPVTVLGDADGPAGEPLPPVEAPPEG